MDSITNNGEDWISGLPVSVLVHILSFLPTKYTVRTSVLSSRWKHHWTLVPILDFDNVPGRHCQTFDVTSFMNFVDRVLFFHDLPCIQRFSLKSCGEIDMSRLNLWIRVLIKHHIQELNVIIYTTKFLFLPLDLFTCKTLVVLTLGIMLRLSVPSSISFPVLKTLNVSLALPNNTLTQTLFCNCPKLEDLFIEGYVLDSERVNVNISTPVLKTLVIEWYCWYRYRDCYIVVNTPILEHLSIRDDFLAHYDLCILPLLIKADINVGDCYIEAVGGTKELADRARVLVEKFSQVKFLSLGASSMKVHIASFLLFSFSF